MQAGTDGFREDTKTQEFLDFEKVHGYNVFKMQASIAVRMPLLQGGILYDYELEETNDRYKLLIMDSEKDFELA